MFLLILQLKDFLLNIFPQFSHFTLPIFVLLSIHTAIATKLDCNFLPCVFLRRVFNGMLTFTHTRTHTDMLSKFWL